MTTATLTQSYATIAEADVYLAINSDWLALTDLVKTDALLWGRYAIDTNFNCVVDYSDIDEEVKYANSLLAYDYFIQGDLFFDNQTIVSKKLVKAGKVETEKTYQFSSKEKPNSFSKVVAILAPICSETAGRLKRA